MKAESPLMGARIQSSPVVSVPLIRVTSPFCRIVAVGGDGIFNEIMEAVITKEQNGSVLSTSNLRSPRVRLGIIPAGNQFCHYWHS